MPTSEDFFAENWMVGTYFRCLPLEIIDIIWEQVHRKKMSSLMQEMCMTHLHHWNKVFVTNRLRPPPPEPPPRLRFAWSVSKDEYDNPAISIEPHRNGILVYNTRAPSTPMKRRNRSACVLSNSAFIKYCIDHHIYSKERGDEFERQLEHDRAGASLIPRCSVLSVGRLCIQSRLGSYELIRLYYTGGVDRDIGERCK